MSHPRTLIAAAVLALLGTAAVAATEVAKRVAPVSTQFTNAKGDWLASVWTDPDTGCEYLIRGDFMLPRLGRDGQPRCGG